MSGDSQPDGGRNSYLRLVRRDVPEEIARFEIESDPYANMLGTGTRSSGQPQLRLLKDGEAPEEPDRRRHPVLTLISLVIIVVWIVLPAGLLILSRTGTWP